METIKIITTETKEGYYQGGIEINHKVFGLLWRQYSEALRLTPEDAQDDAIKMKDDLMEVTK